jgi:hypothetical protein
MIDVIYDYKERVSQIEKYLNFLLILDNTHSISNLSHLKERKIIIESQELLIGQFLTEDNTFKIESELIKIQKSNTILLLYNLIEGTISSILNEYVGTINKEKLNYSNYKSEIKQIWIKYKHRSFNVSEKKEIAYIVNTIDGIINEVIEIAPKTIKDNELGSRLIYNYDAYAAETQSNEISGNLDARKIKDLFQTYGLPEITRGCNPMLKVKNKRNSLAHGNETFAQVGGNYTVQDLFTMKNEIKSFLDELLTKTEVHLREKKFLIHSRIGIMAKSDRTWWKKLFGSG